MTDRRSIVPGRSLFPERVTRRVVTFGAVAAALAGGAPRSDAQTARRRVGYLSWFAMTEPRRRRLATALEKLGWTADVLDISYESASGVTAKADEIAARFVASGVDLIVTSATPAALAAKRATARIPIVAMLADPLASGVVTNLARPEANVTGFSTASTDMAPKRLAIAREIVPALKKAGFLGSTRDPNSAVFARQTVDAGALLAVEVKSRFVPGPEGFAAAIAAFADEGVQALLVQPLFLDHATTIVALAAERRIPVFADQVEFAQAGAIAAFGASVDHQVDGAAGYVNRILRGAKPGDLPFQQVDQHVLVINQKAAKAHGLTVPTAVLLQADEVIE